MQGRDDVLTVSSTKIRNLVDSPEQLDVILTTDMVDPTRFFSFIEVRDRKDKVGRPYVQQIMGKRISLGIDDCKIVSTKEFTRPARKLANQQGIPLRLLITETDDSQRWYEPNVMQIHKRLLQIEKCAALVRIGDVFLEVQGGQMEFLVRGPGADCYEAVSVSRVFEAEVAQQPEFDEKLFTGLPADGRLYETPPITVEFSSARLHLRVEDVPPNTANAVETRVFPVEGIRFFVTVGRLPILGKIVGRYRYFDAVTREKLSDVVLGSFDVDGKGCYLCLLRCKWEDGKYQVGGVFFE